MLVEKIIFHMVETVIYQKFAKANENITKISYGNTKNKNLGSHPKEIV